MNRGQLHRPPRYRTLGAFSLLEVLIASTILALVVVLLLGMVDGASSLWRNAERRRDASREVRAGLRMMAEDLHSAVLTTAPDTLLIEDSELQVGDGNSLFFLVSHPPDHRHDGIKGDLCATGYFIAPAPEGNGIRNLYRFHASGDDVADAYAEKSLPSLYATASPGNKNTELLARNITDLRVHPISISEGRAHPDALQLTLSAVNGDTARLIGLKPEANERNKRLLQQHQLVLSTLVSLPPQRDMPRDHQKNEP